jgi:uridine kinase
MVIDGDDFYAGGTDEEWDAMTGAEKVQHVIDWRRQRSVLEDLSQGRSALWFPYDWEADTGQLSSVPMTCPPSAVVILEGAYSARPELADLFALRVLVDAPTQVRKQRLLQREGEQYRADWDARWSSAEDDYFGAVLGEDAFDLVIDT